MSTEQQVQKTEVTTLSEAVSILMQATDKGREAGIYNFEDLEFVIKARAFITKSANASPTTENKERDIETTKD